MGFMDKVKSLGEAGKEKLDAVQAKRRSDALLRDLGAMYYADRTGRGTGETAQHVEDLVGKLQAHEAEHGQLSLTREADGGAAPAPAGAPAPAPAYGGMPQAAPAEAGPPPAYGGIPQPAGAPGVPVSEAAPGPMAGGPLPDAASQPPVTGQSAVWQSSPMAPPAGGSFIPGAPAAPAAAPEPAGEPAPEPADGEASAESHVEPEPGA
jgi:hypothetical protein